jgi:prepilin-type N-terminal cleavage/methylation domain-containing protein
VKNHQRNKFTGGALMGKFFKRINRNNKGFTLVELLIVVAILGVLSAVVLPNFIGLADEGQVEAAKAELITVQTAMDVMMTKAHITSVIAVTVATSNMSLFPTGHPLYPDYLRTPNTNGTYTWGTTGLVAQADDGY